MANAFLDQYESLDIIGNGSFGIIRKVRRKSDGVVFARKELNFERMSERDKKQIVAEVNILKDLHHEHIVRYHDRYADRDAGILYIIMEYCGGGDLSTIIKQASKQNRLIPEDTIWNYFLQILLALHHCHHPNGHARSGSGSVSPLDGEGSSRRAQILHRDLKPDNVFLDEHNRVKLGDFGLSKALAQASFANTYVGTPYYMSPELMQERAYDSKSDIWSLGCLIYELCALKPPFHEAKSHSELSILIRNGRIPPLPRGYSNALTSVIKSMLNLNPAMRPSVAQLLQHERIEFCFRVTEAEKLMATVKSHRTAVVARESEIVARERALAEREKQLAAHVTQKDNEILLLRHEIAQLQENRGFSQQEVEAAVKHAIARREDELRVLVTKREEEVANAMAKREEEIMEAVRKREQEICDAWVKQEQKIREEVEQQYKALEERTEWALKREAELKAEEEQLQVAKEQLEARVKKLEQSLKGRKEKAPLEEVKNVLSQPSPFQSNRAKFDVPTPKARPFPVAAPLATPITRPVYDDCVASAMKGVVFTSTGEALATPSPNEIVQLFNCSPKVGLNFAKIFDFEDGEPEPVSAPRYQEEEGQESPPPSPTSRKTRERRERGDDDDTISNPSSTSSSGQQQPTSSSTSANNVPPPTRIRRPSIRGSTRITRTESAPLTNTDTNRAQPQAQPKPLPHPHLRPSKSSSNLTAALRAATLPARNHPSPEYDFADEENLPSPFLKRIDRTAAMKVAALASGSSSSTSASTSKSSTATSSTSSVPSSSSSVGSSTSSSTTTATGSIKAKRRPSSGLMLRAVAAANNATRKSTHSAGPDSGMPSDAGSPVDDRPSHIPEPRPSLASARKASEEARKALFRP